jgi:membrane-associated phospholipid phosphatase
MEKTLTCILSILLAVNLQAQNIDIDLLKQFHGQRNTNLDMPMKYLSEAAPYAYIATPFLYYGMGLLKHNKELKQKGFQQFVGLGITTVATYSLKRIVDRPRPGASYPMHISPVIPLYQHSFPSGHSSSSFWWATSMTMAEPKWYVYVPAFAIAGTVAYSRMHMGVHYPSDIAAGAVLGVGSALVSKRITTLLQKNKRTSKYYNKIVF